MRLASYVAKYTIGAGNWQRDWFRKSSPAGGGCLAPFLGVAGWRCGLTARSPPLLGLCAFTRVLLAEICILFVAINCAGVGFF